MVVDYGVMSGTSVEIHDTSTRSNTNYSIQSPEFSTIDVAERWKEYRRVLWFFRKLGRAFHCQSCQGPLRR